MVFWEGTQPRVHETGPFTHQAEAVPLDNFDHDSNLGTETLLTPSAPTHLLPSLKQSLERAVIWILCSTTALCTSKQLMLKHGYHYPATIALRFFAILLCAYLSCILICSNFSNKITKRWSRLPLGTETPRWQSFIPSMSRIPITGSALAAAASIPMLLEGILHMPSLPVLVMLFPIIYAVEDLVLYGFHFDSERRHPIETLVTVSASFVILYNEYRLMVPGLIWGISSMISIGISRALFLIGSSAAHNTSHNKFGQSELDSHPQVERKFYQEFVVLTSIFGLVVSGLIGYYFERVERTPSYLSVGLMAMNVVSILGTFFSGIFPFAYFPIMSAEYVPRCRSSPELATQFLASLSSNLILLLLSVYLFPVVLSGVQVTAYLVSVLAQARLSQTATPTASSNQQTSAWLLFTRKPTKSLTFWIFPALLVVFGSILYSVSDNTIGSIQAPFPSALDHTYDSTNNSRFDIVISMYTESPESVKTMIESLKTTSFLQTITPNVIVYTKDPHANLELLKSSTGADTIYQLENLGREGGTYLHHIVSKWDSLAEQTLFIQAHAHNIRELLPRINDYLVAGTGMLSLGFTGVTCDCNSCTDRWGWEDKWEVIPRLYEKIYDKSCDDNTQVLMSYKGQFVASGRRIRGISKAIYEDLLAAIASRDGWSHDAHYVIGPDSGDNPYFGFTVERIWGLLMQCTDQRVAYRCPSLLSGMGRAGKVEDCQCLDDVRE